MVVIVIVRGDDRIFFTLMVMIPCNTKSVVGVSVAKTMQHGNRIERAINRKAWHSGTKDKNVHDSNDQTTESLVRPVFIMLSVKFT